MHIFGRFQFVNEAQPNNLTLMMNAKVQDTGETSINLACVEEIQ